MKDLTKANFIIIQDCGGGKRLYVGELIGGKVFHSKKQAEAKRFFTFDEADEFWRAKLGGGLDVMICELSSERVKTLESLI